MAGSGKLAAELLFFFASMAHSRSLSASRIAGCLSQATHPKTAFIGQLSQLLRQTSKVDVRSTVARHTEIVPSVFLRGLGSLSLAHMYSDLLAFHEFILIHMWRM